MKTRNLFYLFLSSILLLTGFSSCNDSTYTLSLGYSEVYAKLGEDMNTYIYSGNGGYVLSVDNEAIFTATEKNGVISIKPLALGKSVLTVTDKENQVAKMTITVIQPYMALGVTKVTIENNIDDETTKKAIQDNLEKNMILKEKYLYDLTKTTTQPFASYKEWWNSSSETNGNYAFETSSDTELLKFTTSSATFEYVIEKNADSKVFYDYFVSDEPAVFSTSTPIFNLTADLTEKYKEEFPDQGVNGVKVTVAVQIIPYRYTYAY